jgi:two-component system cell cycle response regulator
MKHIIHVDNSDFFRKLMKSYLSEQGLDSESFASGKDALNAIEAGKANYVITGLSLADMSGAEFIKRLNVSSQAVGIIVVTSTNDSEQQTKNLNALGVKAIIQKSGDWQTELKKILK